MSTRHRDELIVALRDGGETFSDIALFLGITSSRVKGVYFEAKHPTFPEEWAERFWEQVRDVGRAIGCWEWLGSCDPNGYGSTYYGRGLKTHRVAWELTHGPIPRGLWVLHHCDNPPCVRPDHLFLGTHLDNMADKIAKSGWTPRAPSMLARLDASPV